MIWIYADVVRVANKCALYCELLMLVSKAKTNRNSNSNNNNNIIITISLKSTLKTIISISFCSAALLNLSSVPFPAYGWWLTVHKNKLNSIISLHWRKNNMHIHTTNIISQMYTQHIYSIAYSLLRYHLIEFKVIINTKHVTNQNMMCTVHIHKYSAYQHSQYTIETNVRCFFAFYLYMLGIRLLAFARIHSRFYSDCLNVFVCLTSTVIIQLSQL